MSNTVISAMIDINILLSVSILLVLAIRYILTRYFGGETLYAIWALIPVALIAAQFPARTVIVEYATVGSVDVVTSGFPIEAEQLESLSASVLSGGVSSTVADLSQATLNSLLIAIWAIGILLALTLLVMRQRQYLKLVGDVTPATEFGPDIWRSDSSLIGPAVVGCLRQRIILPQDFEDRFSAEEQKLVLAHEQVHLSRGDAYVNGACALISSLLWFNPFVHLAARQLRIDQELACDAAVLRKAPRQRKMYGHALLKAFLQTPSLPIGCQWGPRHPMKERMRLLSRAGHSQKSGIAVISLLAIGTAATAWASQPVTVQSEPFYSIETGQSLIKPDGSPILSRTEIADDIVVRNALGIVQVITEPRSTYAIEVYQRPGFEMSVTPSLVIENDSLVFDGGFSNGPDLCTGGTSEKDRAPFHLVVRTPIDVELTLKDSLRVAMGNASSGTVELSDCVDMSIGGISNTLDLTLLDASSVRIGELGGAVDLNVTDEASFNADTAYGPVDVQMSGSGSAFIGEAIEDIDATLNDSASLRIRELIGKLKENTSEAASVKVNNN